MLMLRRQGGLLNSLHHNSLVDPSDEEHFPIKNVEASGNVPHAYGAMCTTHGHVDRYVHRHV